MTSTTDDLSMQTAALSMFTPLKYEVFKVNIDGITFENVMQSLDRFESEIMIAKDCYDRNLHLFAERQKILTKILMQVPGNKTKGGVLCAAAKKMIDAVAPRPYFSSSDVWFTLWWRIRPKGNTNTCYSRRDILNNLNEVNHSRNTENAKSQRLIRSRELLMHKFQSDTQTYQCLSALLVSGDDNTVIETAETILREEAREENYPDGTELDLDGCDFCSSWIVGDHRCSCGNRRVSLECDGIFLDGTGYFYALCY